MNRVDKLTLTKIDLQQLYQYAVQNNSMNSFVLRINFRSKVTLQVFVSSKTAMCFTSNFSQQDFYDLFFLLCNKYGIEVKLCKLCTSVWTWELLSRIGNVHKFYLYCKSVQPTLSYEYEPELFPCLTISFNSKVARVFHTGKVVFLGIRHVSEIVGPLNLLSELFFDYSLSCNLENF